MRPDYDQVYYDCKAIETFMNQATQSGMFENIEQAANLKRSFDNVKAVVLQARDPKDFEHRLNVIYSIQKGLYGMAAELGNMFPQSQSSEGCLQSISGEKKSYDKDGSGDPGIGMMREDSKFNGVNMGEKEVISPRKEGKVTY